MTRQLASSLAVTLLGVLTLASNSVAFPTLRTKNLIQAANVSASYDFVICGGGLAGLVLASRLSEDANHTVLVLEAGQSGDAVRSSIDVPANAYYSSLLGTAYDWQYMTEPQQFLNNRPIPWARGKVLGGSTAVNGLYLVRPSELEVDSWRNLLEGMDGNEAWSWASLFQAMKKSETFSPPSQSIQKLGHILYDTNSHGTTGPLHYSYPGFLPDIVGDWTATLDWIGVPPSPDANGGSGWGGFIATSSINPSNLTRSYSRSAYIDPLPPRPNLHILPNAMVTRIVFAADGQTATGVEYASARGATKKTVGVGKEVLLTGGAIGSPHILMHSGVGPKDVLAAANVPLVHELPGVGQHLQDHLSTQVIFKTSADTAASIRKTGDGGGKIGSFVNSAIAYTNITDLLGDYAPTFQNDVKTNLTRSLATLVPSQDDTVRAGYQAVYEFNANTIMISPVGQVELLLSLTGTQAGADTIAIQAALQHPFSQGRLWIASNDPFDDPKIDPNYLSHPADTIMLREGLKLARTLGQTQPLNHSIIAEVSPGAAVATDADWDTWLAGQVGTEFHPSCTCSMLPLSKGGVVDANLKVYGLANVRVADSSVYPIQFAAHLQAPTYGLAEQAAEIIRAQYNGVPPPASISLPPAPSPTQSTGSGSGSGKNAATINTPLTHSYALLSLIAIFGIFIF